jgi:GNAT superfamily N-acetyltransferase
MTESTRITETVATEHDRATTWVVRSASESDIDGVGIAVEELLLELGGRPPSPIGLRDAVRALIEDESQGVLLVAESVQGDIVGFLGVSWQIAARIPGRYGTIQELWVHPAWRSREVGAELLAALRGVARERGVARIEVGLPSERFPQLQATEAFYRANGFEPVGVRMKLALGEERDEGPGKERDEEPGERRDDEPGGEPGEELDESDGPSSDGSDHDMEEHR